MYNSFKECSSRQKSWFNRCTKPRQQSQTKTSLEGSKKPDFVVTFQIDTS
jgi:hypothetical protein